jgi:hypothetical protein
MSSVSAQSKANNFITTDTINTQNGCAIILRSKNSVEHSTNKFRTSVKVSVKDKKTKDSLPLSFVGVDQVMIQTGNNGSANLYLEKGKYKFSANYIGYKMFKTRIKIDLHYDYKIEIFIQSKPDLLYGSLEHS